MLRWHRLLFMLLTALAVSCAAPPAAQRDGVSRSTGNRDQVPRLIVQVCTPKDVRLARLHTVARGDGVGSVSGSMPQKLGQTELEQSVYETYSAFPQELVATVLRVEKSDLQFVFLPKEFSATGSWTAWIIPHHASADPMAGLRKLHGRNHMVVPTPENSPKLRYRLMTFSDYLSRVRARREGMVTEAVLPC